MSRAITDAERPWVEAVAADGLEALDELYERLELAEVPWAMAASIGRFVADKAQGHFDPPVGPARKSAWRAILRLVGAPGSPMPDDTVPRAIPGLLKECGLL